MEHLTSNWSPGSIEKCIVIDIWNPTWGLSTSDSYFELIFILIIVLESTWPPTEITIIWQSLSSAFSSTFVQFFPNHLQRFFVSVHTLIYRYYVVFFTRNCFSHLLCLVATCPAYQPNAQGGDYRILGKTLSRPIIYFKKRTHSNARS